MKRLQITAAKPHTPEYLLHKYWARKPHNVIAGFLRDLVPPGGCVVDPFCGSGVVLREAQKQGMEAHGFDVNPVAVLISSVLTSPPGAEEFVQAVSEILERVEGPISAAYSEGGETVRYCVHAVVAACPSCGLVQRQSEAVQKGKALYCRGCGEKLRLNLEHLADTEVLSLCCEGAKEPVTDPAALLSQGERAKENLLGADLGKYSFPFAENRRILALRGMSARDLFTTRNFSILCRLSDLFEDIGDPRVRDAARLLLSASAAQCSRLIASRQNLTTGGPAWSIPGFWVPAVHLETNPLVHLRARLGKFVRGLRALNAQGPVPAAHVEKTDALAGVRGLAEEGKRADLVFFDPPYGDSVPYLEFSAMWNSFLRDFPPPERDFSVSDRLPGAEAWEKYRGDLGASVEAIRGILKPRGRLLITFNNNDLRAWEALLGALQANGMECEFVTYQIPAVVSSKAQKAIGGSYISDIYSVYKKGQGGVCRSLSGVSDALARCAAFRGGVISRTLCQRTMMLAWLENNISAGLLGQMDSLRRSLFEERDGMLVLRGAVPGGPSPFAENARGIAREVLSQGPCPWPDLYGRIASSRPELGIPDPHEVRAALGETVVFAGKKCAAFVPPMEGEDSSGEG